MKGWDFKSNMEYGEFHPSKPNFAWNLSRINKIPWLKMNEWAGAVISKGQGPRAQILGERRALPADGPERRREAEINQTDKWKNVKMSLAERCALVYSTIHIETSTAFISKGYFPLLHPRRPRFFYIFIHTFINLQHGWHAVCLYVYVGIRRVSSIYIRKAEP
jgi:hypothetical protein